MLLLGVQSQGCLWCISLFAVLFLLVHAVKLALMVRALKKRRPPEKKPEPVYFLVERKKRPKKEYSEPKEIGFR